MSDLALTIDCYTYDHTCALFDGTATIDWVDVRFESARTHERAQ